MTALARQWRFSALGNEAFLKAVLDQAMAKEDDIAVMECVVAVVTCHTENLDPLIKSCFEPGLRYLTAKNDARWINGAWFTTQAKTFFSRLSPETADPVLNNLMSIARLDTHAEWILAYIARGHAAAVWAFLGLRIREDERERDRQDRYEAIPYQFHELPRILSQDAASAVRVARGLYTPGNTLFQFRGGRLLSAMFPAFPENLAQELTALAHEGSDDDVGFILQVLRTYQGQPATHEVVKELVARLPEDDSRLEIAEICLQSTGVVSGEFGFVEAYRVRKAQIETWQTDTRPQVRAFAERFIRRLDQSIVQSNAAPSSKEKCDAAITRTRPKSSISLSWRSLTNQPIKNHTRLLGHARERQFISIREALEPRLRPLEPSVALLPWPSTARQSRKMAASAGQRRGACEKNCEVVANRTRSQFFMSEATRVFRKSAHARSLAK